MEGAPENFNITHSCWQIAGYEHVLKKKTARFV